jgi:hypothetical protein
MKHAFIRLIPHKIIYHVAVYVWAWASVRVFPDREIHTITMSEAVEAWEKRMLT